MTPSNDMVPWLHFTGGGNLFFKSLKPSSKGAIAGACLVLVVLAIVQRWLNAFRANMVTYWTRSAMELVSKHAPQATSVHTVCGDSKKSDSSDGVDVDVRSLQGKPEDTNYLLPIKRAHRTVPPFMVSHDLPRGTLYALQTLLSYVLMLAVMTFQVAYIISIVLGLGLGELAFGRVGSGY